MGRCSKNAGLVFLAVYFLVICTHASGAIISVQDVSMSFPVAYFYEGGSPGYFHLTNTSTVVGNLQSFGSPVYDYAFDASVTVTHSNLKENTGTGVWAEGSFYGGATLTITGDLWAVDDESTLLVDNGTILEAVMVLDATETWVLSEIGGNPGDLDASVDFNPSGASGLNAGIDLLNGDELVIGDFRADFGFPGVMPMDPSSFGMIDYFAISSTLQMTAVPEPATLVLLAIGGLSVVRRKRKEF